MELKSFTQMGFGLFLMKNHNVCCQHFLMCICARNGAGIQWENRNHNFSYVDHVIAWNGGIETGIEIQCLILKLDYNSLETKIQSSGLAISQAWGPAMAEQPISNSGSAPGTGLTEHCSGGTPGLSLKGAERTQNTDKMEQIHT